MRQCNGSKSGRWRSALSRRRIVKCLSDFENPSAGQQAGEVERRHS